jgi:hypothetical protein
MIYMCHVLPEALISTSTKCGLISSSVKKGKEKEEHYSKT